MSENLNETENADKYLVFQLGSEYFATPLIEIRSVIEFQHAKPIPHTKPYFKGVINIRGEIVGVMDLRERLNIKNPSQPNCQLILDTDQGPLAVTVDRVKSVSVLTNANVESRANLDIESSSDRPYFLGIGKLDEQLLTLISLKKIASTENVVNLRT